MKDPDKLSYTSNADGYMLYYKGQPLGGASVMLPREKPLHWRHRRANIKDFAESAQREINDLKAGRGQHRYKTVIDKIDGREGG